MFSCRGGGGGGGGELFHRMLMTLTAKNSLKPSIKECQQQYTRPIIISLLRTRSLSEIQAILLSLIKSENMDESILFTKILDERWKRMEYDSLSISRQNSLRKNFIITAQEDRYAIRKAIDASVGNLSLKGSHPTLSGGGGGSEDDFFKEMTTIMNNLLVLLVKNRNDLYIEWVKIFFLNSRYHPNATSFAIIYKHPIDDMDAIVERMLELDINFKQDILPLLDAVDDYDKLPSSLKELAKDPPLINGELDDFLHSCEDENFSNNIYEKAMDDDVVDVKAIKSASNGIYYIKGALNTLRRDRHNTLVSKLQLQEALESDCDVFGFQKAQTRLENSEKFSKRIPPFLKDFLAPLSLCIKKNLLKSLVFSTLLKPLSTNQISLILLNHLFNNSVYQNIPSSSSSLGITMVRMVQSIGDSLQKEIFLKELSKRPLAFLSGIRSDVKKKNLTAKDISFMNARIRRLFAHEQERKDALEAGWSEEIPLPLRAELVTFLLDLCLKTIGVKKVLIPSDHSYASPRYRLVSKPINDFDDDDDVVVKDITLSNDLDIQENLAINTQSTQENLPPPPTILPVENETKNIFQHRIIHSNGYSIGYLLIDKEVYSYLVDLQNNSKNYSSVNGKLRTIVSDSEIRNGIDGSRALNMPMVIPPRPWLTTTSGGYLTQKEFCIRLKSDPVYRAIVQDYDKRGLLDRFLRSIDLLSQVSWQINVPVLKVALEMWNNDILISTKLTEQLTSIWKGIEDQGKDISMRCDLNYRLEIARSYTGIPFYFPYNVDFRGRAYPIPALFSHIGNDVSRGLLLFSEPKPLGPNGLRWLYIHLTTSYGFGKCSLDERVLWAKTHLKKIIQSADDPHNPEYWWTKGEEPWQVLACCMEIRDALNNPQGPSSFMSRLPVQQDGSCNGLQHYAALGRDVDGALQVNVSPSPIPQDVYAEVSRLVEEKISKFCLDPNSHISLSNQSSNSLSKSKMASILKGKISRKLVKQTVMTNVYGITKFGAREQILNRFDEIEDIIPLNYCAREHRVEMASFLVDLIFDSLGDIFKGAQAIQNWLVESSLEIGLSVSEIASKKIEESFSKGSQLDDDPLCRYPQTSVLWTSPLGMPVMQPYLKVKSVSVQTILQKLNLKLPSGFDAVDHFKQSSSMPPNFVHSLDASHMLLTAELCNDAGITFASVHDCFWSHAGSIDEMNRLLRLAFVDLHRKPILEDLRKELIARYKGYLIPVFDKRGTMYKDFRPVNGCGRLLGWRKCIIKDLPPVGLFDVSEVINSDYFFS